MIESIFILNISLLAKWAVLPCGLALQLLDAHYPVPEVREYGVNCLRAVSDLELADYLLQLVQVLKYEPHHDSPLSRFILQRALNNRERLGHSLFWHLKAELGSEFISERYTLLLEAYLQGCGDHIFSLAKQHDFVYKIHKVAEYIKARKKGRKEILTQELSAIKLSGRVGLPISSNVEIGEIFIPKCKFMDSFTVPLWLVMKNSDPFGEAINVMFKAGDDLRADILTLQMFRIMDKIWQSEGLDMQLSVYQCTATHTDAGMIEIVPNSTTTASIQKDDNVVTGALKKTPLARWLREKNPNDESYGKAVANFIYSLAGYCVGTYVLGIGDRHNDNIMITTSGHLFRKSSPILKKLFS